MEKNNVEGKIKLQENYKPEIDLTTDWGKGVRFKTCDGNEVATMEEVMQYNQRFYEKMMNEEQNFFEENDGMHR